MNVKVELPVITPVQVMRLSKLCVMLKCLSEKEMLSILGVDIDEYWIILILFCLLMINVDRSVLICAGRLPRLITT